MTITDNGRVELDEDTLTRAREIAAGGQMPSKREMQKHLGKGWPVVNAVLTRLGEEAERAAVERRRRARAAMRRLTSRKRPAGPLSRWRDRQQTVNESPPVAAPAQTVEKVAKVIPLTPEKHPEPAAEPVNEPARKRPKSWPLFLLALPAFAAVWSGWVGLGRFTGFGVVQPFPGIPGLDGWRLDTAITLPIGVETYGAYALYIWLSAQAVTTLARRFAMWSAFGSLTLGGAGQITYHLLVSDGPWMITTAVSCLPVLVLGMGAALRHLVQAEEAS